VHCCLHAGSVDTRGVRCVSHLSEGECDDEVSLVCLRARSVDIVNEMMSCQATTHQLHALTHLITMATAAVAAV